MKNIIIIFTFFIISTTVHAQSYDGQNDQKINIGYQIYGESAGIKATYDYGLSKLFSMGIGATYFIDDPENDYYIFLRTNIHFGDLFDLPPQTDIYAGAQLGYLSRSDIGIGAYAGIRYFVSKKIGLYAEIGTTGAVGISFTF